ncbi:MAG: 50S ribosomal protein L15 [Candidatus Kapabacteria bacterium]|nr:50S ribosomal protein L15 [Candidatus Kapabacteria bacterium]
MKHIGNLQASEGAKSKKKRIGRGPGSGHGGTATRGHKGQQSRSGAHVKRFFEGGQMPLNRRIPKFGFNNMNRIEYQIVNVSTLQTLFDEKRLVDNTVDFDILLTLGVISKRSLPLKILGNGDISASLNIIADSCSESAKQKIESAGGKVTLNG